MSSEVKELRCERTPIHLLRALDALAAAEGMSRSEWCIRELEKVARRELDKISMQHRMLRGNPLYPEPGPGSDE